MHKASHRKIMSQADVMMKALIESSVSPRGAQGLAKAKQGFSCKDSSTPTSNNVVEHSRNPISGLKKVSSSQNNTKRKSNTVFSLGAGKASYEKIHTDQDPVIFQCVLDSQSPISAVKNKKFKNSVISAAAPSKKSIKSSQMTSRKSVMTHTTLANAAKTPNVRQTGSTQKTGTSKMTPQTVLNYQK